MSPRRTGVQRPLKKSEFAIEFATRQAERGWTALLATTRNAVVDAWDLLSTAPTVSTQRTHRLKGELATVLVGGRPRDRWQHELPGGARMWYYVEGQTVHIVDVHTHHPNQTK